jgi:hypothetical protein
VAIDAVYVSDHMFYSYLESTNCDGVKGIEVVDPIYGHGDDSVARFFKLEDSRCKMHGGLLCPVRIKVKAIALIRPDKGGKLLAELKSMLDHETF